MKGVQKHLLVIVILGVLGFVAQSSLTDQPYLAAYKFGPLATAYLLFGGLTFGVLALSDYILKEYNDMFGKAFLAGSMLKLLVALGFLLFLINDFPKMPKSVAIHILLPYFIFLFYEVFWALKALKIKDL